MLHPTALFCMLQHQIVDVNGNHDWSTGIALPFILPEITNQRTLVQFRLVDELFMDNHYR